MVKHIVARCLISSLAGTVIGLATVVSTIGSSVAAVQSVTITAPDKYSISHVVLFLKDSSGTISRVKIDNFPDGIMNYDPTKVLSLYPNSQLVAYSVKAGNNKDGDTSDGVPLIINSSVQMSQLPLDQDAQNNTQVYLYNQYTTPVTQTTSTGSTTSGNKNNKNKSETQTPPSSTTTPVVPTPPSGETTPVVPTPPSSTTTPVVPTPPSSTTTPVVPTPPSSTTTPVVPTPPSSTTTPVVPTPPSSTTTPVVPTPSGETTPVVPTPPSSTTTPAIETSSSGETTPVVPTPPTGNSYVEPSQPSSDVPNAPKTTKVPEPGTMAALALFGLGGLLAKKKVKS